MRLPVIVALALVTGCSGASPTHALTQADASPSASTTPLRPTASATPHPTATAAATDPVDATVTASPVVTTTAAPRAGGPTATPPAAGTTVVTEADSGRTVRLQPGDRLEVRLTRSNWDPPASSDATVLVRRSSHGGYPSNDPVVAVFQAIASGSADVTSQTDYACFHTTPQCYPPVQQWTVHVVVL